MKVQLPNKLCSIVYHCSAHATGPTLSHYIGYIASLHQTRPSPHCSLDSLAHSHLPKLQLDAPPCHLRHHRQSCSRKAASSLVGCVWPAGAASAAVRGAVELPARRPLHHLALQLPCVFTNGSPASYSRPILMVGLLVACCSVVSNSYITVACR